MKDQALTAKTDRQRINILVIDDEPSILRAIVVVLDNEGYNVSQATTMSEALKQIEDNRYDLIVTDLCIGEDSGLDIIRLVKEKHPTTDTIMATGFGSIENAVEALQAGATDYITKPISNQQLRAKTEKILERKLMKLELHALRQHVAMNYGFDNIVGISKNMAKLKETAKRVAPTDISVLITGASGSGKELFARAIHHHSERRNERIVAIDCSTIPETLMESELFGHCKGSFTSAHTNKIGLFEEANNGTIFLDEVANIPMAVQAKLLRFLQNSEVRPVGAKDSFKVDVRIVAATNRDLATMVKSGEFRDDLYYRLNVIPINLPSLTERAEDIEILTHYFLRRISDELGKGSLSITRRAVDRLLNHNWPGNVRELENTLKRAAALCTSTELDSEDMMFITNDSLIKHNGVEPTKKTLVLKAGLLDNNQRTLIIRALNDNQWNYTKTAAELGIGRTTLWRKIKKYDLKRELGETV